MKSEYWNVNIVNFYREFLTDCNSDVVVIRGYPVDVFIDSGSISLISTSLLKHFDSERKLLFVYLKRVRWTGNRVLMLHNTAYWVWRCNDGSRLVCRKLGIYEYAVYSRYRCIKQGRGPICANTRYSVTYPGAWWLFDPRFLLIHLL